MTLSRSKDCKRILGQGSMVGREGGQADACRKASGSRNTDTAKGHESSTGCSWRNRTVSVPQVNHNLPL